MVRAVACSNSQIKQSHTVPLAGGDGRYLFRGGMAEQSTGRVRSKGKEKAQNEPGHWGHAKFFKKKFYYNAKSIL